MPKEMYDCPVCGKSFRGLKMHMKQKHPDYVAPAEEVKAEPPAAEEAKPAEENKKLEVFAGDVFACGNGKHMVILAARGEELLFVRARNVTSLYGKLYQDLLRIARPIKRELALHNIQHGVYTYEGNVEGRWK